MVQTQALGVSPLAQLQADDVARVTPVLLDRCRLGERVLRVEDDEVGVAEELYEALDFSEVVLLVLGVGRVDDDPAAPLESIAIGIATVALELGLHREAGDLVLALRLEPHELDP